jgi:DNA-directed RNA polymerase subunit omega
MIVPSPDHPENRVGSKYALVIVAAKRARQLKEGAPPLARSSSANPLTVALEEVAAGKVIPVEPEETAPGETY